MVVYSPDASKKPKHTSIILYWIFLSSSLDFWNPFYICRNVQHSQVIILISCPPPHAQNLVNAPEMFFLLLSVDLTCLVRDRMCWCSTPPSPRPSTGTRDPCPPGKYDYIKTLSFSVRIRSIFRSFQGWIRITIEVDLFLYQYRIWTFFQNLTRIRIKTGSWYISWLDPNVYQDRIRLSRLNMDLYPGFDTNHYQGLILSLF